MKKRLKGMPILIALIAASFVGIKDTIAQNLIQNPGLEEGDIPTSGNQIDKAPGWGTSYATYCFKSSLEHPADLLDKRLGNTQSCGSSGATNIGIPNNYRANNKDVNPVTNGNRYFALYSSGNAFATFNAPLQQRDYIFQFYTIPGCGDQPDGSLCLQLNNTNNLGTVLFPSIAETQWTRYSHCFSLVGNTDAEFFTVIHMQYKTGTRLFDDFRLDMVDAGTDKQLCNGSNIQIGPATPIPNATYSWSPVTGLNNPNIANPTATVSSNTTYTVSVTVDGCTGSDAMTVTVNSLPAQPSFTGDNWACDATAETYTISSPDPALTYNWSITGGTLSSATGTSVNATWPSTGGTISVVAVNAAGCNSPSASLTVNACCRVTDPAKTTVYLNDVVSTGGTITGSTSTLYVINGTYTVNSGTQYFNSTEVFMGTNSKIIVKPGATLRLNYTATIFKAGCGNMWEGIEVQESAGLRGTFYVNGATIQDAKSAIVSKKGSYINIASTTLNKNYKSIVIESTQGAAHAGVVVRSTKIQCLNADNTAGTLLPPHTGKRTYIGIEVQNVSPATGDGITIGTAVNSAYINTFNNLDIGILSGDSKLTVLNCSFTNITYSSTSVNSGNAIFSGNFSDGTYERKLKVGGSAANELCTFSSCTRGVKIEYPHVTAAVNYNSFTDLSTAIDIRSCTATGNAIEANYNTINNCFTGIYAYNNAGSASLTFNGNTINTATNAKTNSTGIQVENGITSSLNTPALYVQSNTIKYVRNGIKVSKFTGPYIQSNTINDINDLGGTNSSYGIWLTNTPDADVRSNLIRQTNAGSERLHGIRAAASANVKTVCNTVDKFGKALFFDGACSGSKVANNKMQNSISGIYLGASGVVGEQISSTLPSDNLWEGTFTNHFMANGTDGTNSRFYLRNNDGTLKYPNPLNNYAESSGIPVAITGLASGTSNETSCTAPLKLSSEAMLSEDSVKLQQWKDIAEDKLHFPLYDASAKWMSKYLLWNVLKKDNTLMDAEPVLANFHTLHKSGNLAKLSAVNDMLAGGEADMVPVEAVLNTIVTENDVEETLKAVLGIIVSERKTGKYNQKQVDQLRTIAAKCPYSDGFGVYSARVILASMEDVEYTDNCNPGRRIAVNTNDLKTRNLKLYPNPANTFLNIETDLKENETGTITFYNSIGALVFKEILNSSVNTVSLDALNPGIYMYQVQLQGKQVKAGKLSVIK